MDSNKNNGKLNLNKYRTHNTAGPSTSTPSMASNSTRLPTSTTRQVAPIPRLPVVRSKSKEKELRRKKRRSEPVSIIGTQAQPRQFRQSPDPVPPTRRIPVKIDLSPESLRRKQRPSVPSPSTGDRPQSRQSAQSPVSVPETRRVPIDSVGSLHRKQREPVPPTGTQAQPRQFRQSPIPIDPTTESLHRKQRPPVPVPPTNVQPRQSTQSPVSPPETRRLPINSVESLPRKQREPVPPTGTQGQPRQFRQSPVPFPQTRKVPVDIDLTTESLHRKQRPPVPVPPTQSNQSSTPSTDSRKKTLEPLAHLRAPAPAPPTPAPFSSTFTSLLRTPDQSSLQQILPLLTVIKDQQTTILTHNATSDRSLRDLVAGVGKLSEWAKQKDEETKEKETKDKANEEREKEKLKALILLAQKVDDVRKRVVSIETVVGVSKDQDKITVVDRLQNIEMEVGEWLERARDPDAAMALDQRRPLTPSSLSPAAPTVVRHEMAVSPIKVSSRDQAISTHTPEPVSKPKSTLVNVSTQVDTSNEPPTHDSFCVPCSNNFIKRAFTVLQSMNIEMSNSTASAPSHLKGKEVDKTFVQEGPQVIDDNPFQSQPNVSLTSIVQAAQTDSSTSSEAPCKLSDRKNDTPFKSRPESEKSATSSFSPADWTKTPTPSTSTVEGSSSRVAAVPSTIFPSGSQSYTLPPLPEGTVAALRKEVLVDPYPFPLESAGLGDGGNLVSPVGGVVGASVEAANRMPSPQSQCEEDNMDDIYDNDNPGEQSMPEICDTQLSESKRPHSHSRSLTPQPMVRQVAESAPIQPIQYMDAMMRRSNSMSTESSLTSLSTSNTEESSTPRAEKTQSSTPAAPLSRPLIHLPSQTSNSTEDEDTVMTLVADPPPTSPAPPSLLKTTSPPVLGSASTLVLVSPEPERTRPINGPRDDDPADEDRTRLQEWYKEQRMKVKTTDKPEGNSTTTQKDVGDPEKADSIPNPRSPREPAVPEDQSTSQTDNISGNDPMSPLFTSPSVTPPKREGKVVPVRPEPPSYLKKLVDIVKDDDDVDIVPLKRKRTSPLTGSERSKEKSISSPPQQPPPKKNLLLMTQNKRQPSKAKTRIKRRKISQEPITIESDREEEEEEDQPPLKRVKLRLSKAPVSKVATSAKPKSVAIVTPMKTPMRRVRDHPPRTASVVWPKLDNPVFDQFIECDICERWYHVGCVGIHPDDIRLSASEIFRCPPCDAGVSKEGELLISEFQSNTFNNNLQTPPALTPVKNPQGNKHDEACSRPKCLCPRRTRSIKKETTFTVESFIGMVKKSVGGRGIKLVYLVKWLGYGFKDATWEEEAAMGLPDPGIFVEEFEEKAKNEGIDLSECNNSEAALLRCAIEAGWKRNGVFIRKET